jgi:transcription termination factor Rho
MSEKTKPKTAKKKKAPAQQSVLGNLPSTRPSRLARRHPEPAKVEATAKTEAPAAEAPAATEPRATEPAKKAGTRTTKPAAPRRTAKAKPAAAKRKPRATVAAFKAPEVAAPGAAEAPAPKTFDRTAASGRASARGPRAVRAGSPSLEQPERREPAPPPSNGGVPRGTELVTTAIQAAGELTKIGITVGSQIVKRTLDRLPRR